MSKRTFFAAKVNIHGNIFSQNLDELINIHIPRVIISLNKNPDPLRINSWNWTFTDVDEYYLDDKKLILGNVTKSKYTNQKVRIGGITVNQKSEYELARTAFFIYDPKREILVHESTGSITAPEFRSLFTKLLSTDPYVGEVIINPIPIPHKIRKELLAVQKITQLNFHLIHPNPGQKHFNLYQEMIHENGIKELDISMGNKNGFDVTQSNINENTVGHTSSRVSGDNVSFTRSIENGIELVESGYGDLDFKGFDEVLVQGKKKMKRERRKKSFSSRNSVRLIKTTEQDKESLISKLFSFILDVKSKIWIDGEGDEKS